MSGFKYYNKALTLRYIWPCPPEFPPNKTDWLRAVDVAKVAGPIGRGFDMVPPPEVVLKFT